MRLTDAPLQIALCISPRHNRARFDLGYRLHRIALSVQITEAVTAADASIKKFVEDQIAVVESYGLLPAKA